MIIRKDKIDYNNIMDLLSKGSSIMLDKIKLKTYNERNKAPIYVYSKQNKIQKLTPYKNI